MIWLLFDVYAHEGCNLLRSICQSKYQCCDKVCNVVIKRTSSLPVMVTLWMTIAFLSGIKAIAKKKPQKIRASTRFKPMTPAIPVQRSDYLSYEAKTERAGHFSGSFNAMERCTTVMGPEFVPRCKQWSQEWLSRLVNNQ